jgi:hypothetical protein
MSFIPSNRTLQLSDSDGNISHIGVLASNTTTTPLLGEFPTTSTGDSLGHYHYSEPGTNALKFLNVAGTGSGGHKFYTANSTTAPVNTASIGLTGLTIDTTITNTANSLKVDLANQAFQIIDGPNSLLMTLEKNHLNMSGPNTQSNIYNTEINLKYNDNTNGIVFNCPSDAYGTGMQCYNNNSKVLMIANPNAPQVFLSNQAQTTYNSLELDKVSMNNGTTNTVNLNGTTQTLTLNDGTHNSVLSTTNLTFNNIDVKMNQVQPTLIYSSTAIYADGQAPATSLSIRNTYGYSGWYFKNISSGQKINWYFPPKNATNTLVSDLKGVSISFFNGATTSNDNTLFITIYTRPTGTNDYAPGFFHSANTYIFNQSITPVANTNYQGVCIIDKSKVPYNYETQIQYQQSPVNNPRGNYQPTDNILAVTIGSNSASPTNSVELVVNKLNLHYADFTQSYLLVPP